MEGLGYMRYWVEEGVGIELLGLRPWGLKGSGFQSGGSSLWIGLGASAGLKEFGASALRSRILELQVLSWGVETDNLGTDGWAYVDSKRQEACT